MQSTFCSTNLENLFQTLWRAQQEYLADAVQRSDIIGDFASNNPATEVANF